MTKKVNTVRHSVQCLDTVMYSAPLMQTALRFIWFACNILNGPADLELVVCPHLPLLGPVCSPPSACFVSSLHLSHRSTNQYLLNSTSWPDHSQRESLSVQASAAPNTEWILVNLSTLFREQGHARVFLSLRIHRFIRLWRSTVSDFARSISRRINLMEAG